jgi:tRNA dimethylallyltransferase
VHQKILAERPNHMMNRLQSNTHTLSGFQKTVFIIAGPTAVGKTAVAIKLAQKLGTSIISADSRQCYKEMTIGTAKPSPEELASVRHFFIDDFSVKDEITAADYERLALSYLDLIFREKDVAVVCGGTGLYIKALTEGLDDMPEVDETVAAQVNDLYKQEGLESLQQALSTEDPLFFAQAETENPARLMRALIFKRCTGRSITEFRTGQKKQRPFLIIKCVLDAPREELYRRIDVRVDQMMEQGLLEEVKSLYAFRDLKNLQTVGYSELFDYLDGKYELEAAINKIKQHTRNYAKRQLTWFRKDKAYHWFDASDEQLVEKILALKK